MIKKDLARVLRRMEHFRLTRLDSAHGSVRFDDHWSLSENDLARTLVEHRAPPLLFNRYDMGRVLDDLERAGVLRKIRARGYDDLQPFVDSESFFENRFRLMGHHPLLTEPALLVECRTHQGEAEAACPWSGETWRLRVVILDWVNFQDPARAPSRDVPFLPGQEHPGLGIFREAMRLTLTYLAEMDLDAVVNIPEFFHNAVLYAPFFRFFDPTGEGRFLALKRDLLSRGLAESSHALAAGRVLADPPRNGSAIQWEPAEQVYPLSPALRAYFEDARYQEAVAAEKAARRYRIAPVG